MAEPGEMFPQQFAMGILQLYNTIQTKKADLNEMRQARAQEAALANQRNTLGYAQIESGMQERQLMVQGQVETAKIAATAEAQRQQIEWDARLKLEAKRVEETQKAAYETNLKDFADGKPAFFAANSQLPDTPLTKIPGSNEEIPAFGVHRQVIPGKGTFLIPYDPRLQSAKYDKIERDRQKDLIDQIDNLGRIERNQAETDKFNQDISDRRRLGVPKEYFEEATRLTDRVERKLAADMEKLQEFAFNGVPSAIESLNSYKKDPRVWLKEHLGDEAYNSYLSSSATVKTAHEAMKTPENPSAPGRTPDQLHGWVAQQMDRITGQLAVKKYAPEAPPPPEGTGYMEDTVIFKRPGGSDWSKPMIMVRAGAGKGDIAAAQEDPNLFVVKRRATVNKSTGARISEDYFTLSGNSWDPKTGKIKDTQVSPPAATGSSGAIEPPILRTSQNRADEPVSVRVPGTDWSLRLLPQDANRYQTILDRVANAKPISPADSDFMRQMQYEQNRGE